MATLSRPGVEISQEIRVTSPTVLTPALVPCVVGPCFQIVEPLTSAGSLNSSAGVAVSASIKSTADLGDNLALTGRKMVIDVGGNEYTVNFPTTLNNEPVSQSLMVNTINKAIAGATAAVINKRLVITTTTTGKTARITLVDVAPAASSAYGAGDDDILSMNSLVGVSFYGQGNYGNRAYTIPYSSFPSPMTDVSNVIIQGADATFFRFFNNTLVEFSEDSAINSNSYTGMPTKVHGQDVTLAHQPAIGGGRSKLVGIDIGGAKSNAAFDYGTDASVRIPLSHAFDKTAAVAANKLLWPDVSGENFLEVRAKGYNYSGATSDTAKGSLGNAIKVKITHNGGGPVGGSIAYANQELEITGRFNAADGENLTYLELGNLITASKATWEDEIEVTLNRSSLTADTEHVFAFTNDPGGIWVARSHDFFLGGGTDPVNFSSDAILADKSAKITGSMPVAGGTTATTLGIVNGLLEISIDGGDWIPTTFAAGSVIDQINAKFSHAIASSVAVTNTIGESVGCLQLAGSTSNGHDSSIAVRGHDGVIAALFGGASSQSATGQVIFDAKSWAQDESGVQGRRFDLAQSGYNANAASVMQKAVKNGSVKIELTGVKACGVVISAPINDAAVAALDMGAEDISFLAGAIPKTASNIGDTVDVQAFAANLDTKLKAEDANIAVTAAPVGDGNWVILFAYSDATTSITFNAGATSAGIQALLTENGTYDIINIAAVPTEVSLTIQDSGATDNNWEVTSISSLSNVVGTWTPTYHTERLLQRSQRSDANVENASGQVWYSSYSTGDFGITFLGDHSTAVIKNAKSASLLIDASSRATVSWQPAWANALTASTNTGYTSRVFHGRASSVKPGDTMYNAGVSMGKVVAVSDYDGFTGARVTLSEFSFKRNEAKSGWYVVAENLPTADRVAPEASYSDLTQEFNLKAALLRKDGVATQGEAPVYVQYRALRKDVTAADANPGILVFSSPDDVETLIGPIDTRNPLAFGLSMAFMNTTDITVSALGVSEVTADAPEGTLEAYAEAFDFLGLEEVYAIAPMTHSMEVFKKLSQHVIDMSAATGKKERMCVTCPSLPTEKSATLVGSATFTIDASPGGGKYNFIVSDAEQASTDIAVLIDGLTDSSGTAISGGVGSDLTPSQGVYLDREGDGHRWLVTKIVQNGVQVDTSADLYRPGLLGPGTGGNDDSYFRTGAEALADFEADGEKCSIGVRQAAIDVSTTAGKLSACETLAAISGGVSGFKNRRMIMVQPEKVAALVGGMETVLPGYYLTGAIAAMIGQQSPSQPFTNFPMVGFTRPLGSSDKFSETQMATGAAGGIYWVIQDVAGGPLVSRHQLTTDVTSLKTRELSILKSVDFVAKGIRNQIKGFIGRNNITTQLLETVALSIQASLEAAKGSIVSDAKLTGITQDSASMDTIKADVDITPFYPANKISVTIYV